MSRPKNDGWRDPRSSIGKPEDRDGKVAVYGSIWIEDVEFSFRVNEQKNSRYAGRGAVSLISPNTGKTLQVTGPEKRRRMKTMDDEERKRIDSGKRSERLNATRSIYFNSIKIDSVKTEIENAARKLLLDCFIMLEEPTSNVAATQGISFMRAVYQYKDAFISQVCRGKSLATQNKHRRTLENACAFLARAPMNAIRQQDIKRIAEACGIQSRSQLSLLSRFWQWCCQEKRVCMGENPFETFLQNQAAAKKSTQRLQQKAMSPNSLPEKVAEKIDMLMAANFSDGRYMGALLAKEAGIASVEASKLCWGDVIFMDEFDNYVRIRLRRDETVGATHDYTRPVSPFGAGVLRERYSHLQESFADTDLQAMPVVSTASNPAKGLRAKDITAFCKDVLFKAGMKSSSMLPDKNAEHGAGSRLLLGEYRQRLSEVCGLDSDTAALRFLCGLSLGNDVTADHYRSFTSPEGQWYLYRLLCRDARRISQQPVIGETVYGDVEGDKTKRTFDSEHPDMLMCMKCIVTLKAGEELHISSLGGIEGTVKVVSPAHMY